LAVGDAGFQKKCIQAMEGMRNSGRTVLFVSHNLAAVENLCSRGIWIDGGRIRMDGGAKEIIKAYMASFADESAGGAELTEGENRLGNGDIRYTRIEYFGQDGTACASTRSGDYLVMRFHYRVKNAVRYPSFGFLLYTAMGTLITETGNVLHGIDIPEVKPGDGFIDVEIDSLNLLPTQYYLTLLITDLEGKEIYDGDARTVLEVEPVNLFQSGRTPSSRMGIAYFPQRWRVP
jgi:lipopolysaccharide transport system ATP-binding protein